MINEKGVLEQTVQLKKSQFADSRFIDGVAAVETLIKTAPKVGEWIPVSERPPEDPDESVLITVNGIYKNITFEDAVMLATYDEDEGWIIDGYQYWLTAQVTAWRSLPEPYKEEKDGK